MITYGHTGGSPPDQAYWDNLVTTALTTNGGRLVDVASAAAFNTALADARPDDVIRIANGSYSSWTISDVTSRSGTSGHPIIVIPRTRRGVTFTSPNQFLRMFYCNYWVVGGFDFVTVPVHVFSLYGSSNNTFTDCKMTTCGVDTGSDFYKLFDLSYYGVVGSSYNTYSWLELVLSRGFFRLVSENQNAGIYKSQYNTWKYITFDRWASYNHAACIQLGAGSEWLQSGVNWLYDSYSTVQYCLFSQVNTAYNELISIKVSRVTVEFCKFADAYGYISLRLGNNSTVRYNYRVDTVRISDQWGLVSGGGDSHQVYGNIVDAKTGRGFTFTRGGAVDPRGHIVPTTTNLDCFNNTIKLSYGTGSQAAIHLGRMFSTFTSATYALGGLKIKNNILIADAGDLFRYDSIAGLTDTSLSFENNVFYKLGSARDGNAYSLNVNPIIGNPDLDSDYRPSKTGSAYSAGVASSYTTDFYGDPRKSVPDVGAVERGGVAADQGFIALVGGEVGVVAYDTTPYSSGPTAGMKYYVGGSVDCSARGLLVGPDAGVLFLQGGPKQMTEIGPEKGTLFFYGGLLSSEIYDWSAI